MPLKLCAQAGCNRMQVEARCEQHRYKQQPKVKEEGDIEYGRKWKEASTAFRSSYPLCELCLFRWRTTAAHSTDHIIPHRNRLELFWDQDNWQPICIGCHSWKTRKESGLGDWQPAPHRVVICGLPASGKTTLANRLATQYECDVFDMDKVAASEGLAGKECSKSDAEYMVRQRQEFVQARQERGGVVIAANPVSAMLIAESFKARLAHCIVDESERFRRIDARDKATDEKRGMYGTVRY